LPGNSGGGAPLQEQKNTTEAIALTRTVFGFAKPVPSTMATLRRNFASFGLERSIKTRVRGSNPTKYRGINRSERN
jgi:hypothetical protein